MRKLYEIFKVLKVQKKNSFRGNYSRKYGINLMQLVLQICFSFFVPHGTHGLEFHVMHSNSMGESFWRLQFKCNL